MFRNDRTGRRLVDLSFVYNFKGREFPRPIRLQRRPIHQAVEAAAKGLTTTSETTFSSLA